MKFLLIALSLVVDLLALLWGGFVLQILWRWFFVPPFGLPPLSWGAAIGIDLIVSFLTKQLNFDKNKTIGDIVYEGTVTSFVRPAIFLLLGWIITWFF